MISASQASLKFLLCSQQTAAPTSQQEGEELCFLPFHGTGSIPGSPENLFNWPACAPPPTFALSHTRCEFSESPQPSLDTSFVLSMFLVML